MSRMTIRTREAPMEWEREQDRNLPNIFAVPQALESELAASKQHDLKQTTSSFGSFSSSNGLQKESSFTSQLSQGSTFEGWGSATQKPFRQDSQLASGQTMSRQGSSSFSREGSFTRPDSLGTHTKTISNTTSTTAAVGSTGGSTFSLLSNTGRQDKDQRLSSITDSGDKTSSFDMGSLRGDVLDKEQEKRQSLSRSSVGHDLGLQSSGRPRSNLQYRSHTEPSLWSDGDEDDTRDLDMDMDEDLDGHDRRLQKLSRNKSWSPQDAHLTRHKSVFREQKGRGMRFQPRSQPQRRAWSENVDLPFILSGYVQTAMNAVFAMILVYLAANFITSIQSEVSLNANSLMKAELDRVEQCRKDYDGYYCDSTKMPDTLIKCRALEICMSTQPSIGRASIAARTFGLIVDSFVHAISFKTMGFVIILVFGGFYVSNNVLSAYRSNYILHHQDYHDGSAVRPTSSPVYSRDNMGGSKRRETQDTTFDRVSLPTSREFRGIGGRELPYSSGRTLLQGDGNVHSRALVPRPHGVLQRSQDSDGDHDVDMHT